MAGTMSRNSKEFKSKESEAYGKQILAELSLKEGENLKGEE